jgi:hypothetical protein
MSTKTKPIRVPEEDQGAINPLAGVFGVNKKKELKFKEGRITYEPISPQVEEDGMYAAWEIRTNADPTTDFPGHYAGILHFDHKTAKFFHYGLRQTNLDGKDSADKVGASKGWDQAVKNLLKMRYPDEFKAATGFDS